MGKLRSWKGYFTTEYSIWGLVGELGACLIFGSLRNHWSGLMLNTVQIVRCSEHLNACSGIWYLVPGTWYQVPEHLFSKPEHLFRVSEHLFVFGEHCSGSALYRIDQDCIHLQRYDLFKHLCSTHKI